jgi:acetyl esterase/lipase
MMNLSRLCFVALLMFAGRAIAAPPTDAIPLWPGPVAPGDKGDVGSEVNKAAAENKQRITNVTRPTIQVHRPAAGVSDTGAAVIVCPGGGYNVLATDIEGDEIVKWLNGNGVTGIVLKYRVPRRKNMEKHVAPLQDVQRAIGMVRHHAKQWGFDPNRIGIIGFSAGGHLAACASTNFASRTYPKVDEPDDESCRPDFAMLIYPFYMTTEEDPTKLAAEFHVSEKTPPTFIVMTQDDRVHYAYTYALALKSSKVPAELHVFAAGGHGYGLGRPEGDTATWPKLAENWMKRWTAPK